MWSLCYTLEAFNQNLPIKTRPRNQNAQPLLWWVFNSLVLVGTFFSIGCVIPFWFGLLYPRFRGWCESVMLMTTSDVSRINGVVRRANRPRPIANRVPSLNAYTVHSSGNGRCSDGKQITISCIIRWLPILPEHTLESESILWTVMEIESSSRWRNFSNLGLKLN